MHVVFLAKTKKRWPSVFKSGFKLKGVLSLVIIRWFLSVLTCDRIDPHSLVSGGQIKVYAASSFFTITVYYLPTTYISEGLWKRESGFFG